MLGSQLFGPPKGGGGQFAIFSRKCDKKQRLGVVLAVSVTALCLSACGHTEGPATPPAPLRPPPILCQPLEDRPGLDGGVVRPVTEPEIKAFDTLLDRLLDRDLWADRGWLRAKVAKDTYCR